MFLTLGLRVLSLSRTFSTSAVASFPKLKTHQGAKKRWKAISSGAFKRAKAGHSHLNVSKRPDRKNRLSQLAYSSPTQTAILKKAMPYS
ncbi:ribosomal protein L35 [Schizopora paradoxa]|uniref:50S ribosomal protein L35 n=1 Tax=Schizopora paradoxa TaxID=27342 RepID=A0A0H2RB91_9AGAM|nr:ribosomal protein L35 [Schizopora paradoxa]